MDNFNKDEEKILCRAIDNANALVFYCDQNGTVSLCNKKSEEFCARSRENIIGQRLADLFFSHEKDTEKYRIFQAIVGESLSSKRANNFENAISDSNNNERFISWNITPFLNAQQDVEGLLFIGNDITDLKKSEFSLKKIEDTVKDVCFNIRDYGMFVANLEGNITYYGMGSESIFGWSKEEVIFKHLSVLFTPEDARLKLPFILDQIRKFSKHEEPEIYLQKKDGETLPVILTATQLLGPESNLAGYIFIAKDISETKKIEFQILQTEKLAALGQLAAGMAHEINNPLFVISGRIELLIKQKGLFRNIKPDLKIISEQAERIRKLVERMLMFARSSPLKLEAMDINNCIEAMLPFISYQKLIDAKIKVEMELAPALPMVKGDLNQLQEVFMNLFMNACQAMPTGGTLSIKTGNFQNRFAQIQISDTGYGISEHNIKNIFMPFFSTKKNGTGLGLSICHNIIKNHNGSISLESQLNKGTTFTIRLPFA